MQSFLTYVKSSKEHFWDIRWRTPPWGSNIFECRSVPDWVEVPNFCRNLNKEDSKLFLKTVHKKNDW